MNTWHRNVARLTLLVSLAGTGTAVAQTTNGNRALTLEATGRFARGGEFAGTVTINRFALRDNEIVAIGFLRGTLSRGHRVLVSVLAGEQEFPVVVRAGGQLIAHDVSGRMEARPARWTADSRSPFRIVGAQAEPCPVVQIGLGPVDVNVLGIDVAVSPIALDLVGETGTPLGGLLCSVLGLLGRVAELVDVLNGILGLVTGLLGGIGGLVP